MTPLQQIANLEQRLGNQIETTANVRAELEQQKQYTAKLEEEIRLMKLAGDDHSQIDLLNLRDELKRLREFCQMLGKREVHIGSLYIRFQADIEPKRAKEISELIWKGWDQSNGK